MHWPTGLRATQDSTGAVEEELPADVSAALEAEQGLSCASGDSCLRGAHAATCSTPPGKGALRGAGPAGAAAQRDCCALQLLVSVRVHLSMCALRSAYVSSTASSQGAWSRPLTLQ